jgi:DNA repair protein RadA/Sms
MKCTKCKTEIPDGKLRCPNCKEFQITGHSVSNGSVLLSDVVSSDIDRIATGPWDEVFGTTFKKGVPVSKGVARSSVNLLGGAPGCGKSTLILQGADKVCTQIPGEVLYLAAEEPTDQIKARADRLGIEWQGRIRMVPCMTGEANVEDIIIQYEPIFLLVDSVSAMAGDDMNMQVKICMVIKNFCSKYRIPAIALSHINKSGEIAGLEALQHAVDSVISFFPDGDGQDAPRVLHVEKNRNGLAFITYALSMTEKGLVPFQVAEEDEEDDDDEDD